jgi:hypothetical protein
MPIIVLKVRCVICKQTLPKWLAPHNPPMCPVCIKSLQDMGVTFFNPDGTEYGDAA